MKKSIVKTICTLLPLVLVLMMAVALVACGGTEESSSGAKSKEEIASSGGGQTTKESAEEADDNDSNFKFSTSKPNFDNIKPAEVATNTIQIATTAPIELATIKPAVVVTPTYHYDFHKIELNFDNIKSYKVAKDTDTDNGSVTLDSSVLFEKDSYEISDSGKEAFKEFLDAYTDEVLTDEKKANIKRIIVEGHTDTDGSHEYNQTLSENRAKAVMDYAIELHPELKEYMDYKGYSYDYPIYKDDGSVDMDASRRVVFSIESK